MTNHVTRRIALATGAAAVTLMTVPTTLRAQTAHDVQMLNKHPEDPKLRQVFFPRVIVVEAGDTANFVATDKSHNSASAKGMTPEGAEDWKGRINQDVSVTLDTPGFYGYACTPHSSVGMVGLIIVKGEGMMANLENAKSQKQRGKAKQVWDEIWAEVDAMELTA